MQNLWGVQLVFLGGNRKCKSTLKITIMSVTTSANFGNGWIPWVCPVNFALASIWKASNPQLTGYHTGLLTSLLSPENVENAPFMQSQIGNSNQIRLGFRQRPLTSSVLRTKMAACAPQAETPRKELNFDLDKYSTLGWKIDIDGYVTFCNELAAALPNINAILSRERRAMVDMNNPLSMVNVFQSESAMYELMRMMPGTLANIQDLIATQNAIKNDINAQLVAEMYTSFIGAFAGPSASTAPLSVDVISSANGSIVYKGFNDIKNEYLKAFRTGTPIMVGFGLLQRALSALTDYCCNLTGTMFDPNRMAAGLGMKYYIDQHVNVLAEGASTIEDFIVYAPGSMAFFSRNEFTNQRGTLGTVTRDVLPDMELPGLSYDVIVNPNGCTNEIEFQLGVQFDLWAFRPADMYQVGDNLAGVNGVFHYTANAI